MSDTQWPRFEVFQQESQTDRHAGVGSVHAPDGEMALLIARDVFVRRPDCHSLWVAPAQRISSFTAQQLAAAAPPPAETRGRTPESYEVFKKVRHTGAHIHVGQVTAETPFDALRAACQDFAEPPAHVWWLVPSASLVRSEPADSDSFFEPALHKPFRDQAFYRIQTLLRRLKKAGLAQKDGE